MLSLAEFKSLMQTECYVKWKTLPELEFFYCFRMRGKRQGLWSFLSDTSRFNREMGFARREQSEEEGRLRISTTMMGFRQIWIEEPWNWIQDKCMSSVRVYEKGMARSVQSVFYIDGSDADEARVIYLYFGWTPKNIFWRQFLKLTSPLVRENFHKVFFKIDQALAAPVSDAPARFDTKKPAELNTSSAQQLLQLQTLLAREVKDDGIIKQLVDVIRHGDDLDVEPLRVRALAQSWRTNERNTLIAFLHATRAGVLKLSWDVVCPHCRGTRFSAASLGEIPIASSCDVCEVEFSTDEVNSIEVTFHIHPSIRIVSTGAFCAAEPAKKNHIKLQQNVEAHQKLSVLLDLPPGTYRERYVGSSWNRLFTVQHGYRKTRIEFENPELTNSLFVVETYAWSDFVLRPAQVLSLPEFRDLFSEEHLSSNVKLFLGEQSILFTDIVGSTNFYNEVGDAKAFAEVRAHFQDVFQSVKAHGGVVVKTIGDAVMASFEKNHDAITAAIAIQQVFHADRKDTSIRLRISVHSGPVIAVHLNTGIDYFGNTVNLAAKIQSCAGAGEIALSEKSYGLYATTTEAFEVEKRVNGRDRAVPVEVYVLKTNKRKSRAA